MADPVIYGPNASTYVRTVRMALAEKGQRYELTEIDIFSGQNQSEAHLTRHPWGKVPAFVHDGFQLYETEAICRYVDGAFDGPGLQPTDAKGQARMTQLINIVDAYAYPTLIGVLVINRLVQPKLGGETDHQAIEQAMPEARKALGALNDLVGDDGFAVGGRLSLADLHLFPVLDYVRMTAEGQTLLEATPALKALHDTMRKRDSAQATTPQL